MKWPWQENISGGNKLTLSIRLLIFWREKIGASRMIRRMRMKNPAASNGVSKKTHFGRIVGWVEAPSADTRRSE